MKYKINKTDEQGNHISGYEEILEGSKTECENDYRHYYEYDGCIDIEEIEEIEEEVFIATVRVLRSYEILLSVEEKEEKWQSRRNKTIIEIFNELLWIEDMQKAKQWEERVEEESLY